MKVVALLEVQWGIPGQRPSRWFRINPRNHSGRRLIGIIGMPFKVTNACSDIVYSARCRGTPDPGWLEENLRMLSPDVLIVCGRVAAQTFARHMAPQATVVKLPHPAARNWSKERMARAKRRVHKAIINAL